MEFSDKVKLGKKTKEILKSLNGERIILTQHEDLDGVVADEILATEIKVVLNVADSITGTYPNFGPKKLIENNLLVIDLIGREIFEKISDGAKITVRNKMILSNNSLIAEGRRVDESLIESKISLAKKNLEQRYNDFIKNTIKYAKKEKDLFYKIELPKLRTEIQNNNVLLVTRGREYLKDLRALEPYIKKKSPVLVGIDGGANVLLKYGYRPDIIIGDMDSVSNEALQSGAELIVHSYLSGLTPGMKRLKRLGLSAKKISTFGTSEDAAMFLSYYKEAENIFIIGSHNNILDFWDKKRDGMGSTFLIRTKIGDKLIDLKGINKVCQYLN